MQTVSDGLDDLLYAAAFLLELGGLHGRGPAPRLAGRPARVMVDLPPRRLAGTFVLDLLEPAVQRQIVTYRVLKRSTTDRKD